MKGRKLKGQDHPLCYVILWLCYVCIIIIYIYNIICIVVSPEDSGWSCNTLRLNLREGKNFIGRKQRHKGTSSAPEVRIQHGPSEAQRGALVINKGISTSRAWLIQSGLGHSPHPRDAHFSSLTPTEQSQGPQQDLLSWRGCSKPGRTHSAAWGSKLVLFAFTSLAPSYACGCLLRFALALSSISVWRPEYRLCQSRAHPDKMLAKLWY